MSFTVEPDFEGNYDVYEHGVYEEISVLAGQAKRSFRGTFDTVEEALKEYPKAEVLGHSTKPYSDPNGSLADLSGLSSSPPDWFDSADAGEYWDDDY